MKRVWTLAAIAAFAQPVIASAVEASPATRGTPAASTDRTKRNGTVTGVSVIAASGKAEIVIAVVMDEPRGGARDGGVVSAPVFREVAQKMLVALNVPMDMPRGSEALTAESLNEEPIAESPAPSTVEETMVQDDKPSSTSKPETQALKPKMPEAKSKNKNPAGEKAPAEKQQLIKSGTDKTKLET